MAALVVDISAIVPIVMPDEENAYATEVCTVVAREGYDAAYPELADRLDLPLASQDQRLVTAARSEGLRLFENAS
jgi:predicted nucleic acid-binding protein